jgi:hypothetical protein
MISRSKKQVKRKTLLKVIYLKKLKNLLEKNAYWGFCNFVSSDNKIKKNFMLELNSLYFKKGITFYKIRASYLKKLLLVSGISEITLNILSELFKSEFVLLLTNNLSNVINFPFKEYAETKLVLYAWKIKSQLYASNVFLDKKIHGLVSNYQKTLVWSLRENIKLVRLLNKKYNKN